VKVKAVAQTLLASLVTNLPRNTKCGTNVSQLKNDNTTSKHTTLPCIDQKHPDHYLFPQSNEVMTYK